MLTPLHTEAVMVYLFDMFKDLVDLSNACSEGVLTRVQAKPVKTWLLQNPDKTAEDALKHFGYYRTEEIPFIETLKNLIDTGNYDLNNLDIVQILVKDVMDNCKPSPNPKLVELFIKDILLFD